MMNNNTATEIESESRRRPDLKRTGVATLCAGLGLSLAAIDSAQACGWGEFMGSLGRGWGRGSWGSFHFPASTDPVSPLTAGTGDYATVRLSQESIVDRRTGHDLVSHASTAGPGWQTFENVRFDEAENLTAIRWEGYYLDFEYPGWGETESNTTTWEIRIWSDDNGTPGHELHFETYLASGVRRSLTDEREVGVYNSWEYIYNYEVELSAPFLAKAETAYWISITSVAASSNPAFVWSTGAACNCELPPMSLAPLPSTEGSIVRNALSGTMHRRAGDRALSLVGNPLHDKDGDGMSDPWETAHGLDPNSPDSEEDTDKDGVNNLREFALQSHPRHRDTDGDGLLDGVETGTGIFRGSHDTGTSPVDPDTDQDGLPDGDELGRDYHVLFPGDTIAPAGVTATSPVNVDSDHDGFLDTFELSAGYDPVDHASRPQPTDLGTGGEALLGYSLPNAPGTTFASSINLHSTRAPAATGKDARARPSANQVGLPSAFDGALGSAGDWTCETKCRFPIWIEATFAEPITLSAFTLTSNSANPYQDPMIWEIQGSNDGEHYTTIFHTENTTWSERSQVLRFDAGLHYADPQAYSTIRFVCYGTLLAETGFSLGELEFFAESTRITKFEVETRLQPKTGGVLTVIQWCAEPGVSCSIERSQDLTTWTPLPGPHKGTGTVTTVYDRPPAGTGSHDLYYRIVELGGAMHD